MAKLFSFLFLIFLPFVTYADGKNSTTKNDHIAGKLTLEVQEGDTLSEILKSAGVSTNEAHMVINELKNIYNPSKLRLGQKIHVNFDITDGDNLSLHSLQIHLSKDKDIEVTRFGKKLFLAKEILKERSIKIAKAEGVIESTLYGTAIESGIPPRIIVELIKNYSYNIDFQRDIRSGNKIQVLFEQYFDEQGEKAGVGNTIYAALSLGSKTHRIYHFQTPGGGSEFFDESGRSIKKSLLRTPIDGARISSGYGKRRHPILGYTKMHKGLDFAAPRGTPIYAAGNGIIVEIGRKGSYGKYIRISHENGYSSAYAHLKGYARRLKRGRKVKQGQIIGYVGSTGRSTGPHLHYEVLKRNKHINPLSVKMTSEKRLSGVELGIFRHYASLVNQLFNDNNTLLASH